MEYLGVSIIPYLSWVLGAIIGVSVLNMLPVIVTNSFNISLYALFIAILIPNLKRSKTITLMVIITGILISRGSNYLYDFISIFYQ